MLAIILLLSMGHEMTEDELKNATLEAIFWWNSTESNYHEYFSRMDKFNEDIDMFQFFIAKTFEVFLKEYSVRRNIRKHYTSVDLFISGIIEYGFVTRVRGGDTKVIDDLSQDLSIKNITNSRQTRSLLSKIAFLINPTEFSLFDNLAKQSLWEILKKDESYTCRKRYLESYSVFLGHVEHQIRSNFPKDSNHNKILSDYKRTSAGKFFNSDNKAFERRIYDKYLWLNSINRNEGNRRRINNNAYKKFLQIPKL